MLEDHLNSTRACRRLRAGPAAPHVDGFADWMSAKGYSRSYIDLLCQLLATWSDWLRQSGLDGDDLVASRDAYATALSEEGRLRYASGHLRMSLLAASTFVRYLRESGAVAPAPRVPSALDTWPVLRDFHGWALTQQGLAESSARLYEIVIADLLEALGDDPATYTAENLRSFVLQRARPHGPSRAASIAVSVRAFLRFLVSTGRCREGLVHAIPSFAWRRLSSVPRHLEADQVQRVLKSCTGTSPVRLRDRAVLLLLARLGLRASDVEHLSLTDIDWQNGRLAVSGKSRRREWLPLPQDVGDALVAYIQQGRPRIDVPQVFLTITPPIRPLASGSVRTIAGSALRRAGVTTPSHGAHVFRHSAATAMLRQGVSLPGVGAVLRHRSPDTTMHYAKVDFGLLSEVAQPWPGEVSPC
ncbi:MAG: tyrosine-type recombinase/integrase [bacterium]|nr:tyrosine-type recombinase/integrase [bacterium]